MPKPALEEPARHTIYDIARAAGVSSSTVSRVLAGRTVVSEATRTNVLRVARELGYRPNHLARNLARQANDTIALLLPDIANPFFPSLVKAIQHEADRRELTVVLGNTGDDVDSERRYLDTLLSQQIRHVLVAGLRLPREELDRYGAAGLTFIALDRRVPGGNGFLVQSNHRAGARAAVRHLLELGHTRIAHVSGPPGVSVSRERKRGYVEEMTAAGLPIDDVSVVASPFTEEGGAAAFHELTARGSRHTAVFAANDLIAIGYLFAAHEAGLSVPDAFSLIGFDGVSLTRYTSPQITTIRQDVAQMAASAMAFIAPDRTASRRTVTLPVTLEVRQSTAPYRGR